MKNTHTTPKKYTIITAMSVTLHVISFAIIAVLAYNIQTLYTQIDTLNKQSLQFNGRTNNLEGCWKNQDYVCPENKYFDASQFTKDQQ